MSTTTEQTQFAKNTAEFDAMCPRPRTSLDTDKWTADYNEALIERKLEGQSVDPWGKVQFDGSYFTVIGAMNLFMSAADPDDGYEARGAKIAQLRVSLEKIVASLELHDYRWSLSAAIDIANDALEAVRSSQVSTE